MSTTYSWHKKLYSFALTVLALVISCSAQTTGTELILPFTDEESTTTTNQKSSEEGNKKAAPGVEQKDSLTAVSNSAAQEDAKKDPQATQPSEDDEIISLNFEKTSLAAIVNFLAERKNINIVPHKDLATATISLHNYKPLTLGQAWNMLPTLLEINNFTMNKVGNLYRIVNSKESGKEPLKIYSSATGTMPRMLPDTDQMIRYIYFLHNIKVEVAHSILANMFADRSAVEINRDLDVLFIKEKALNIKSAMQIIEELDLSSLRQSFEIIQLNYENPVTIARLFNDQLLGKKNQPDSGIRFLSLNKSESSYFSPNVKIMPDPQRNALILIGQDRDTKRIKDFINQFLDVEPTAESRIHVRDIKYLPAENVQKMIASIIKPPPGISQDQQNKYFEDVNIIAETPGDGSSPYGSGNRIIVTCGKDDWRRIEKLINKLDRPTPQVALEILVVDVSSDLNRQLGAQFRQKTPHNLLGSNVSYGTSMLVNNPPSPVTGSSMIEGGLPNITGPAVSIGPADNIWAVLKGQMNETNTNVIAQPFAIVSNRKEFIASSGKTQLVAGKFGNVQGLRNQEESTASNSVKITPSINSTGIVDLKIDLDFSDFDESGTVIAEVGNKSLDRSITTRASMAEGEVLVIGGLTRTKQLETMYETPFFSKIPILGILFKWKKKTSIKQNLYVFIRPSIVKPEFTGVPDDYTQFKVDYAKRQVFNFQSYGKGVDPIDHFFFKPRKSSISQTLESTRANRFSWIDNFTERKHQPSSVNSTKDPGVQQSEVLQQKKLKKNRKKVASIQKKQVV